jgi:hypothetical protein
MENRDWKVLIVLDACRYDYFEKNYKRFFKGKLKKMESVAVDTMEWLAKSFKGEYKDTVYISATPFINSITESRNEKYRFLASDKFFKVIDVWDTGWDEQIGVTRAEAVNSEYRRIKNKYPDKKFILHYLQPHYPFVPLSLADPESRVGKKIAHRRGWAKRSVVKLLKFFNINIMEIVNKFGTPTNQLFYLRKKYGNERLREEYEKNLLYVLKNISELLPEIDGMVAIIGDHGTLLGEHGKYGHAGQKRYREIVEIPYFEVER